MIASAPRAGNPAARFFEFSLLGMLASGYCAVLGSGELDWPTAVLMPCVLILRVLLACGLLHFEIPVRLVAAVTLLYIGFYPLDYLYVSHSFLTATVHLIFFVASIKILTAHTPRDFNFVKLIAGLELMAAALLSIQLNFFVFLALFLLATIATFASGEVLRSARMLGDASPAQARVSIKSGYALPRRLAFVSTALFCGIFVITAGIFFVLPRTARAALQRFVPQRYHLPGFASEVTLGDIGEIKQRTTPVMHILSDEGLDLTSLRWRGAALSHFDGTRWFNPPAAEERLLVERGTLVLPSVYFTRPGHSWAYEIQLNEIASDTLFFAGTPQTISIPAPALWRSASGSLRAPRYSIGGLRYRAISRLENEEAPPIGPPLALKANERAALLELPALDPRIAALAQLWTASIAAPDDKAHVLEAQLRRSYGYSLRMLDEPVPDPLAHFLFVRKEGHCEYFASALAVMLRSVGIPSRVATGFLGGVFNPISGWQIIRASDAHSWVEAWIPDRGWITLDPTPADPNLAAGPSLWSKIILYLDAADQFWTDWVVGYDFEHQVVLASRMQTGGRSMRFRWIENAGAWLESGVRAGSGWVVGSIALAGFTVIAVLYGPVGLKWWQRRIRLRRAQRGEAEASDATLLYERMLHLLDRRGFRKPPWITPAEFVRVLPSSELALLVEDLTSAYNQVRFGGRNDAAPRMVRVLERIESLATK